MTTEPPRSSPEIQAIAEALRPALLRLSRHMRREAQLLGLSQLDATLLATVKNRDGIGVSELAELEQTSRPTMSAHVKRLEALGWIARMAPDSDDKRRIGLTLTPAGVKALEAVSRRRNDWLAGRLAELSPAEREALTNAVGVLRRIAGTRS